MELQREEDRKNRTQISWLMGLPYSSETKHGKLIRKNNSFANKVQTFDTFL